MRKLERLQIGVRNHELNPFEVRFDHAVDGIASATAHADDLDLGAVQRLFVEVNANVGFRLRLVAEIFDHGYLNLSLRVGYSIARANVKKILYPIFLTFCEELN